MTSLVSAFEGLSDSPFRRNTAPCEGSGGFTLVALAVIVNCAVTLCTRADQLKSFIIETTPPPYTWPDIRNPNFACCFGDYNRNKSTDAADYVLWRKTLGSSVTQGTGADGDWDAVVDADDNGVWRKEFGNITYSDFNLAQLTGLSTPASTKVHDTPGLTGLVAYRDESWWRPSTMLMSGNLGQDVANRGALHWNNGHNDFPEIISFFDDGGFRPHLAANKVPSATVRFGPLEFDNTRGRRYADVASIQMILDSPTPQRMRINYANGESAVLVVEQVNPNDTEKTRFRVELEYVPPYATSPILEITSMFVNNMMCDTALIEAKDQMGQSLASTPVLEFPSGLVSDIWLRRAEPSWHNSLSPDIRLSEFIFENSSGGTYQGALWVQNESFPTACAEQDNVVLSFFTSAPGSAASEKNGTIPEPKGAWLILSAVGLMLLHSQRKTYVLRCLSMNSSMACILIAALLSSAERLCGASLSVPHDYATIQSAINAASYGDTINVAAGVYFENTILAKSGINLRGAGSESTIIDGSSNVAPVINVANCFDVTISGFTITKGGNGGLVISNASPTVEDNEIIDNVRETRGGGIEVNGVTSNPLIRRNVIRQNRHYQGNGHFGGFGGGIYYLGGDQGVIAENTIDNNNAWADGGAIFVGTSPLIYGNVISRNSADFTGGICINGGAPVIRNNLILNNFYDYLPTKAAGISIQSGSAQIINNTIVSNTNNGIQISNSDATVDVRNNIISDNRINGIAAHDDAILEFNDVYGNGQGFGNNNYAGTYGVPGTGSLVLNPLFINPESDDYHLSSNSPAINSGDPDSHFADADHSRNDMGAYGGPLLTFDSFVLGDYNRDRIVNAADYVLWRQTFGRIVPARSSADGNNNGIVDTGDFNVWQSHFGDTMIRGVSTAISPNFVPETSALKLIVFAAFFVGIKIGTRTSAGSSFLSLRPISSRNGGSPSITL